MTNKENTTPSNTTPNGTGHLNPYDAEGKLSFEILKEQYPDANLAELQRLVGISNAIFQLQERHENIVQRNAYLLWALDTTKAYQAMGYKNTATYAKEVLGIKSKGSVSDAISTYTRFGETTGVIDWENPEAGQIRDKYRDFNFSTLMRMKKLSDDEIEAIGITPDMSRAQVMSEIEDFLSNRRAIEKKEKEAQKAVDGTLEMEIDAELAAENETTGEAAPSIESTPYDDTSSSTVELHTPEDSTVFKQTLTYRNGDNMDGFITLIADLVREKLESAIDGHEVCSVDISILQDIWG